MRGTQGVYLGLDLGGTAVKAGLFSRDGRLLGLSRRPLTPDSPAPGQAEIPAERIHQAARDAVRAVTQNGRVKVTALSISSQGETFVALDGQDRPLYPALLWYDSRALAEAAVLNRRMARLARPRGSVPVMSEIFTAAKIEWLKRHHPGVCRKAVRYLLLPDYITYLLTGSAVTDPTTAGSTGLCLDGESRWCSTALEAAEIPEEQLAVIRGTGTPVGRVRAAAADRWGLSPETRVMVGTNDQYAGALGAGNCRPGIVSETSGTCLAMVTLVRRRPAGLPSGMFTGVFPVEPYRFVLAYAKTGGLVLDWFRRVFAPGQDLDALEALALRVPAGCGGLTVVPHFDGRVSPHPDPSVRGLLAGVTLRHGRAEIYRAILEGLTFVMKQNLDVWKRCGLVPRSLRAIGGGASSDLWLQMKADVTGLCVEKPVITEAAVFGAAMIAAVGAGEFGSLEECSTRLYRIRRVFHPEVSQREPYREAYGRYLERGRASAVPGSQGSGRRRRGRMA